MCHIRHARSMAGSDLYPVLIPDRSPIITRPIGRGEGRFRIVRALTLLAFFAIYCGVCSAAAEDPASEPYAFQVSEPLQQGIGQADLGLFSLPLQEVMQLKVTGSTFLEETTKTVPSSVTVFTRKEIRRMGISNLEELMNFVPGFQSARTGDASARYPFSSRGRRIGGGSREVLVLIDGHRLNEDQSQSSLTLSQLIPTENIERVEFIRGPGSALYGSNAFLGVVNIVTVKGLREVELTGGPHDMGRGHINYAYQEDEFDLAFFGKYLTDNGQTYHGVADTVNGGTADTRDPYDGHNLYLSTQYKKWGLNLGHVKRRTDEFYIFEYSGYSINSG